MSWPGLSAILLFVLLCVAGMIGMNHCTQLLVEMGSHELSSTNLQISTP
jgi:hypothetical protein